MEVKTWLENVDLREVRIVPEGTGYEVRIAYKELLIHTELMHPIT